MIHHRPLRHEFADTVTAAPGQRPLGRLFDPVEQIVRAEREDWTLLRLVLCAAAATMVLALASSLVA